jgi:hypothetical protein
MFRTGLEGRLENEVRREELRDGAENPLLEDRVDRRDQESLATVGCRRCDQESRTTVGCR